MKYVLRLSIGLAFSAALVAGVVYAKTQRESLHNIGLPGAKTPLPAAISAEPDAPAPEQPAAPAPAGAPAAPVTSPSAKPRAQVTPRKPPAVKPPARKPVTRAPARPAPSKPARVIPRKPVPVKPRPPEPRPIPAVPAAATLKAQVTSLVNAERATAGCGPVRVDARLNTAAQKHSEDMARLNYFSHDSRDGRSAFDRIRAEGYSSGRAENIAKGQRDADAVMRAWIKSPGHHRNIVDCTTKAIGVGVARGADGALVWTQDFGAA